MAYSSQATECQELGRPQSMERPARIEGGREVGRPATQIHWPRQAAESLSSRIGCAEKTYSRRRQTSARSVWTQYGGLHGQPSTEARLPRIGPLLCRMGLVRKCIPAGCRALNPLLDSD